MSIDTQGLQMDVVWNYSDEEVCRFLDGHPEPLVQELCRRLDGAEIRRELKEAQADACHNEERAEEAESEAEAEGKRADKAEADLAAEKDSHAETEDQRLAAELRAQQLEKHLERLGLAIPEAEPVKTTGQQDAFGKTDA